ncbi:MAG: hypothetical protein LWY06_09405 [Firmicutes bacterium]|nr:hypothetical protein [Bacillota bacterium]
MRTRRSARYTDSNCKPPESAATKRHPLPDRRRPACPPVPKTTRQPPVNPITTSFAIDPMMAQQLRRRPAGPPSGSWANRHYSRSESDISMP